MYRKSITLTVLLAVAVAFSVTVAFAADAKTTEDAKGIKATEAYFSSVTLAENPAKMKDLMKGLGTQKGVLAAKFDDKTKLLKVVIESEVGSIDSIQKALSGVLDDLDLKESKETTWQKKDCSGCPSASKCAKEKK